MANIFDNYAMDYTSSCNNSLRDAEDTRNKELPEGQYQARTCGIWLKPSKKYEDELQLRIGFQVLEGEYKGNYCSRYYAIIPEQMPMLKNDLMTLGIDLQDDIRKLGDEETLKAMDGLIVDINVKHKKAQRSSKVDHFVNVYINRLVGKYEEPMEEAEDDDDNPFE